jgi:hypothetical protein
MKFAFPFIFVAIFIVAGSSARAQSEIEKLSLPGDNLNLYAVMKLFKDSKTLDDFERSLNTQKGLINNLDLDGNNSVDYIRVTDKVSRNIHTITLDVIVNEHEDQDVAVFFLEKRENGQLLIQLVGDEDLYGKDFIIEPVDQTFKEKPDPSLSGIKSTAPPQSSLPNAIAAWPLVKAIFAPSYAIWRSPWRWNYYPSHWKPWQPQYWHYYYGYHSHLWYYYSKYFRKWGHFRNPAWYAYYYGGNFRSRSITVRTKQARGDYKATYSQPASVKEGSAFFLKQHPRTSPPKTATKPVSTPASTRGTKAVKKATPLKKPTQNQAEQSKSTGDKPTVKPPATSEKKPRTETVRPQPSQKQ